MCVCVCVALFGIRLKVFQSTALRTIFGTMREEVRGGWKKLFREKLYNNTVYRIILEKAVP